MQSTTFKDFVKLQRGFDLPRQKRLGGNIPVVGATRIQGYHAESKVNGPGVTTGRSGALGDVLYITEDFWPLNTSLWVKDFKNNDPRYVYYKLKTLNLGRFNSGAGVPTLNRNHLDTLSVEVHDIEAQKCIVGVLGSYDDLIANNLKRIEKLEHMASLVYGKYFDIPVSTDWEELPLDEVLTVHRGKSYKSSELSDSEGLPFINLKCVNRGGGFRKDGLKWFTGSHKPEQQVEKGDLVMAVTDMTQDRAIVARAAQVPSLAGGCGVISMDMVKIQPKGENNKNYFYAMFRWSGFANEVKNHANGANVLHLLPARITDYKTNIPPVELQEEFSEIVAPIFNLIDNLQLKNEALVKARELLLPRLMSGEIEV